ncbi:P-loop NTPase fold protein [Pseudooceanicola pacificus]|nr:P-loop NTPase fold protein [Pseudooceanicola pacificus]
MTDRPQDRGARMTETLTSPQTLLRRILLMPPAAPRLLIGLSGAPGSGKSTLAEWITRQLNRQEDQAVAVPMDGFHLDNILLEQRGLMSRKGAAETFDAQGFVHALNRLTREPTVLLPEFDRAADLSRAAAIEVAPRHRIAVVEGNYLSSSAPPWCDAHPLWALRIHLEVPRDTLRTRLIRRWRDHGLSAEDARARAEGNDMVNVDHMAATLTPPDILYRPE